MASSSAQTKYSISPVPLTTDFLPHAALELLACENDDRCYIEPLESRIPLARRIARTARSLASELSDPSVTAYEARLDDTEQTLVGVAIWKKERRVTLEEMMAGGMTVTTDEDGEEQEEADTEGGDEGFCWRYFAGSEARRREAMAGEEEWWYLKQLFVHPSYTRRGIGSALVEAGLREADKEGLVCVMEATAGAVRLYEQLGFVERYSCDVELSDGTGVLVRPGLVRDPVPRMQ